MPRVRKIDNPDDPRRLFAVDDMLAYILQHNALPLHFHEIRAMCHSAGLSDSKSYIQTRLSRLVELGVAQRVRSGLYASADWKRDNTLDENVFASFVLHIDGLKVLTDRASSTGVLTGDALNSIQQTIETLSRQIDAAKADVLKEQDKDDII